MTSLRTHKLDTCKCSCIVFRKTRLQEVIIGRNGQDSCRNGSRVITSSQHSAQNPVSKGSVGRHMESPLSRDQSAVARQLCESHCESVVFQGCVSRATYSIVQKSKEFEGHTGKSSLLEKVHYASGFTCVNCEKLEFATDYCWKQVLQCLGQFAQLQKCHLLRRVYKL